MPLSATHAQQGPQRLLSSLITVVLQKLSAAACLHPIHAIVVISILVSTTYVRLLKDDLSSNPAGRELEPWNIATKAGSSRSLVVGPETAWTWQTLDDAYDAPPNASHLALLTLAFPESAPVSPPSGLPPLEFFDPVSLLPSTSQSLTTLTPEDGHLAFSVPRQSASDFLSTVQHIPATMPHSQLDNSEDQPTWVMKASQTPAERGLGQWLSDRRAEFLDLLKQSNALDITTMALIYISMNLTFVSLFLSMRNLGSSIWLATSVLLSSTFSFILALDVSLSLGIPITLRLLSESMPFLVVVIGFEKSIILTKAVLSHANDQQLQHGSGSSQNVILSAIRNAIKEKGSAIARHYFVEILILIGGAHSGVHGGLQEVCFLAAWILLFDCVLLFTFYTAILCIKLEVTRIRQSIHKQDNDSPSESTFGDSLKLRNIPYFKFWMVVGFVAVNVVDLFFLPARIETFDSSASSWSGGLDSVVKSPPIEPFKVAASGLAHMLSNAIACNQTTIVTVMAPVKYELTTPSASPAAMHNMRRSDTADMVDSLLASFEDPVLSKWIIAALALSIALNGYLFKAARQSFGDGASAPATPRLAPTTGETTTAAPSPQDRLHATTYILDMEDEAIVEACLVGTIPGYALERNLQDCTRAVKVRRSVVSRTAATRDVTCSLESSKLPYEHYAWERVLGTCCENVIGYTPLPLGVAGPLVIDGRSYYIPMATTEGVLVASASRGSKAMNLGGGVKTILTGDGMTRGPCVSFDTVERAGAAKTWLDSPVGQNTIRDAFNSTSRFARLQSIKTTVAGIYVYIRFKATTGDAMGMNMISKGVEHALNVMSSEAGFADLDIITLSGNYCADKKPTALNWIEGRGKGIVAEAIIPHDAVRTVLKSDVDSMVELNHAKNLVGSAMAGSVGGFNAQAANLAAAVFIATGQDPAQVVEAANCLTQMRKRPDGALQISVTMPSLEVGTLGGGTILDAQSAALDMLGVRGAHPSEPGANARQLARVVGAAVLAGEVSLCAALAAGHLVRAHMAHNRPARA